MYNSDSKFVNGIVNKDHIESLETTARIFSVSHNLPYDECFSEAQFGLAEAVRRFDPTKGFKLTTYASYYIKGRMKLLLKKEISRRNHQAEVPYETAISCGGSFCKVDSDIRYNELLKMVQQYVDDRYYYGLAQKYLDVLELVSTGYKEREAASKCDMELSFFKKINADVRNLLRKHHYC